MATGLILGRVNKAGIADRKPINKPVFGREDRQPLGVHKPIRVLHFRGLLTESCKAPGIA